MSRLIKTTALAILALAVAACGQVQQTSDEMTEAEAPQAISEMDQGARQQAPRQEAVVRMVQIPAGTTIPVKMKKTLDSGENVPGDQFAAKVLADVKVDGALAIPEGSIVRGEVREVKAAKRGAGNASMTLAFNMLILPDDSAVPIVASLSQQSESKKARNAAAIGGGAAGGAILGRIIGKDTKGAVVGAVVGGAIGTGVVMAQDGHQVKIPRGTELAIQLDDHLKIAQR